MKDLFEIYNETANNFLDWCEIYTGERKHLGDNIRMSIDAKADLFEKIFKDNPYYNGRGQLVMETDITRDIDQDIVSDFAWYIGRFFKKNIYQRAYITYGNKELTYSQASDEVFRLDKIIRGIQHTGIADRILIDGEFTVDKFIEDKDILDTLISDYELNQHNIYDFGYTTKESYNKYLKVSKLTDLINNNIDKIIGSSDEWWVSDFAEAFPNTQCREGTKITKVLQKAFRELGVYDFLEKEENIDIKREFNHKWSAYCDALSPMTVKKWSVLSINFTDFLSMSYGGDWTSCLNVDKGRHLSEGCYGDGFNSRRTLDYALDPSTMVFYTVTENYDGNEFELQPKQTRQLFHFGFNKLIQGRLYPQGEVSRRSIYTQYRHNVQHLITQGMKEANLWSAPERGLIDPDGCIFCTPYEETDDGSYIDFNIDACHGDDEQDFQSEVNYTYLKGADGNSMSDIPMTVGSADAVCIECGNLITRRTMWDEERLYTRAIMCEDCAKDFEIDY